MTMSRRWAAIAVGSEISVRSIGDEAPIEAAHKRRVRWKG